MSVNVRACPCACPPGAGSGKQVVGQAGLGALDERPDLAGLQDEGGAAGVGGLAEGAPAAGEFLGFQAGAAVVTPWLAPSLAAEVGGGYAVADVSHLRSPS